MGIDALDLRYRLEKTFDMRLSDDEFYGLFRRLGDPTAGQLKSFIADKLQALERGTEPFLQERVWRCIADALFIDVEEIQPESRLISDLRME